jgi:hypothetical protein
MPRKVFRDQGSAPYSTRAGTFPTGTCSPSLACRAQLEAARPDDLLPVPRRPGAADAARDRRAGHQGGQGRRRPGPGQGNRFIALDGATKSINRELEARARDLAGLKGYVTNLAACPDGTPVTADFVIGSYHQLWNIEKSFRMSKSDLRARPIYHRKRDSIEAHLTIVLAALAITRFIENRTGWSIRKFVRTARRYRTIQIQAGQHTLTAEDPLPPDLRDALALIK